MFALVICFKQKTAYEMRISDWSSDVCSSDLMEQLDENLLILLCVGKLALADGVLHDRDELQQRMVHVRSDLIEQRRIGDLAAQMQQVLRAEQAERLALFHRRHHAAETVAARLVGLAKARKSVVSGKRV